MDYIGNDEQARQRDKKARLEFFERERERLRAEGGLISPKNPYWDSSIKITRKPTIGVGPTAYELFENDEFYDGFA